MRTILGLIAAAMLLSAAPALAAFDIDIKVDTKYAPGLRWQKPTAGRNFGERIVSYVRILPPQGKHAAYPAFITTHNYLTCPDSDKKIILNDVRQVSIDRRSGVKMLGFFFDPVGCDAPTFHMEPITAD